MMKDTAPSVPEYKPSLDVSSDKMPKAADLNVDDEVVVTAIGKVTRVARDTWNKKGVITVALQLTNIDFELADAEDKKEAEEEGLPLAAIKKIRKLREKAESNLK